MMTAFTLFFTQTPYIRTYAEDSLAYRVQSLLKSKCVECHGGRKQEGGLRLDNYSDAKRGGDSMLSIFNRNLEENELVLRINSPDVSYRMPYDRPPLSRIEVELIENWIAAGAPWPEESGQELGQKRVSETANSDGSQTEPPTRSQPPSRFWERLIRFGDPIEHLPYRFWFLGILVVMQVAILVIERIKNRTKNSENQCGRFVQMLQSVSVRHYTFLWGIYLVTVIIALQYGYLLETRANLQRVQRELEHYRQTERREQAVEPVEKHYGRPPVPVRSSEPKHRLARTYYRGNDERSERLYNGGLYQTAQLKITLVDRRGEAVTHGDKIPEDGLAIEFRFVRPPGTADELYRDQIIQQVVMTTRYPADEIRHDSDAQRMTTIRANQEGMCRYPIAKNQQNNSQRLSGLVYIWYGRAVHYAIRYEIPIINGRVGENADLWMGDLLILGAVATAKETKIPHREWFSPSPLPVIEGSNTQDPTLLGIPEHANANTVRPAIAEKPQ